MAAQSANIDIQTSGGYSAHCSARCGRSERERSNLEGYSIKFRGALVRAQATIPFGKAFHKLVTMLKSVDCFPFVIFVGNLPAISRRRYTMFCPAPGLHLHRPLLSLL